MDTRRKLKAKKKLACTIRSGRVEERFRALVEQENFYEAHQTLRALYQRYLAQGATEKALKLLRQGGLLLLKKNQCESGTEVCVSLVRLLQEKEIKVTNEIVEYLEELCCSYKFFGDEEYLPHPHIPGMRMCPRLGALSREDLAQLQVVQTNREMFVKAALKWTSSDQSHKRGHYRLHRALSKAYFEEGDLGKSRHHLLYSDLPETLGLVLVELATHRGHPSESDLFITQTVLQLLVLSNRDDAYQTFLQYCGRHPSFSTDMPPPFKNQPLLNFTWFLILAIDIGDMEVFNYLCQCYTPVIKRDESLFLYLQKIGSLHFGVGQPEIKHKPSGFFDMLMGGASNDSDGKVGSMGELFSSLTNMLPDNIFGGPVMGGANPPVPMETNSTDDLD